MHTRSAAIKSTTMDIDTDGKLAIRSGRAFRPENICREAVFRVHIVTVGIVDERPAWTPSTVNDYVALRFKVFKLTLDQIQ